MYHIISLHMTYIYIYIHFEINISFFLSECHLFLLHQTVPPIPLRYGVSDAYQGLPGKRFRQETIDTESQRTGRLED